MDPRKSFAKINFVESFFQTTRNSRRRLPRLRRTGAFFVLAALLATAFFYSGSSASSLPVPSSNGLKNSAPISKSDVERKLAAVKKVNIPALDFLLKTGLDLSLILPARSQFASFFGPMAPVPETIETLAADCTTPKTSFVLGETVCAKVSGVTATDRFVNWLTPATVVISSTAVITTDPQTFLYTLPTTGDAIGTWKATIADPSDSSINPAPFDVSAAPPAVATYAADCTTPKTIFNYSDTVCAKVSGVEPGFGRRVALIDPEGYIRENNGNLFAPLSTDPQSESFVLPTGDTSLVDGVITVENRGKWKINVVTNRGSALLSVPFTLQGPTPTADLSVSKGLADGTETAGQPITYIVTLSNQGPNAAQSVQLANPAPTNATFQSVNQTAGDAFSCTGTDPVICTAASLPSGASAIFEITYITGTAGSTLAATATATSTTPDLNSADNATVAPNVRVGGAGAGDACTLTCPDNMVVNANTQQGATRGAIVEFAVEPSGNCGAVTSTPASNTFFPVGTTTVSTSSAQGGGACSFTVTVVEAAPPTIECRSDVAIDLPAGETEAQVAVSQPQAAGNGITLAGVRSDNQGLSDPYPIGTTTITWTVTDLDNRTATCTQRVIVTSSTTAPAPSIQCPPPVEVDAPAGSCSATVALGTPVATPEGVSVVGERSDGLALSAPYPAGTTIVTWTASDTLGRSDVCVQIVSVNASDNTPPTVTAPSNRTFFTNSCSIVLDDELGSPNASDNCSGVTITTTGMPAGNSFPTGVTTLTYTATDAAGNTSAPKTQTITVKENPAIKPVITLNGSSTMTVECHTAFTDPGASATDNCDPSVAVVPSGSVNVDVPGTYTVTYNATDASGNAANPVTRTVNVVDTTAPVITITGANPLVHECHTSFTDPGATASDSCDSSVPVTAVSTVNPDVVGSYTITYSATDDAGNAATPVVRTVNVVDTTAPVITITGANPLVHECHTPFSDPGATANDGCAGDLTSSISAVSNVNPDVVGSYSITYTVSDGHNTTQVVRAVNVVDTTAPTLNMTGAVISLWSPNHQYQTVNLTQLVASASDSCDSGVDINDVVITKVTSDETENGNGDGNTANDIVIAANCRSVQLRRERNGGGDGRVYTITFKVADPSGNVTTKTATVKVPKNQNGAAAVDSGVNYTVTSSCQ